MPRWRATCADRADRLREQRPDDDLGALGERLLRGGLRALRIAAVVLHQQLDVRVLEFGQRHLGRVLHRLRGDAGIAGRRQRQDQRDANWPVPMAAPGCASAGCGGGASVVPRLPRFVLVQAASTAAAASDTPRRQQIAHDAHQRSPSTCRRLPASPHGRRQFRLSPNHNQAFCPAKVKPMKSKDEFGAGVVINSPLGYTISHGQR